MTTHKDAPRLKLTKLGLKGKILLTMLLLTSIHAVTLLTVPPALSRVNLAMEKVDFTLRMMPKFFTR